MRKALGTKGLGLSWRRAIALLSVVGAVASVPVACSANDENTDSANDGDNDGSGASGSNQGGSGGVVITSSGGSGGGGGLDECAGEVQMGDLTPVDLVIMFDQSGSMSGDVGG